MFDNSLLDSSPMREPVLRLWHQSLALLLGVLGFVASLGVLPLLAPSASKQAVLAQAAILGVVLTSFALMLVYVFLESRHLGLNARAWCGLTLVLNVVGFVLFLIYSAARTGNWKRATIPVAYALESCLVGVLVVVPLLHTASLGKAELWREVWRLPPAPPPAPVPAQSTVKRSPRATPDHVLTIPSEIPQEIAVIIEDSLEIPSPELTPGIPGGMEGGTLGGIPHSVAAAMLPPPPPPPPARTRTGKPRRVQISHLDPAKLIYSPTPEYPPLARMARIEGTVRLEAVIGIDGRVENLRAVSGHPLLVNAALEAVSRWRYQPTLLNGEPVEVVTEVDVIFRLGS